MSEGNSVLYNCYERNRIPLINNGYRCIINTADFCAFVRDLRYKVAQNVHNMKKIYQSIQSILLFTILDREDNFLSKFFLYISKRNPQSNFGHL